MSENNKPVSQQEVVFIDGPLKSKSSYPCKHRSSSEAKKAIIKSIKDVGSIEQQHLLLQNVVENKKVSPLLSSIGVIKNSVITEHFESHKEMKLSAKLLHNIMKIVSSTYSNNNNKNHWN